jgi:DNA-cytosine methyltransferase
LKVLSLFDGISGGQVALERAGLPIEKYYASEIDRHAITVTQKNYPKTIQLGSVTEVDGNKFKSIDLLIGGSPCQGFSFAGKQLNFDDPRSKLFFEYVRILKEAKPEYFLLENVKMKKQYQDIITEHLAVEPIAINSALLSAQNRQRLYWTNIPEVSIPADKGIVLKDIIEGEFEDLINYSSSGRGNGVVEGRCYISTNKKANALTKTGYSKRAFTGVIQLNDSNESQGRQPYQQNRIYSVDGKSPCLNADGARRLNIFDESEVRKLTPVECERLQTFPDNFTSSISNNQRYKALGNSFTVDVIAHILKHITYASYEDIF